MYCCSMASDMALGMNQWPSTTHCAMGGNGCGFNTRRVMVFRPSIIARTIGARNRIGCSVINYRPSLVILIWAGSIGRMRLFLSAPLSSLKRVYRCFCHAVRAIGLARQSTEASARGMIGKVWTCTPRHAIAANAARETRGHWRTLLCDPIASD
jgi:hypothetical protein